MVKNYAIRDVIEPARGTFPARRLFLTTHNLRIKVQFSQIFYSLFIIPINYVNAIIGNVRRSNVLHSYLLPSILLVTIIIRFIESNKK